MKTFEASFIVLTLALKLSAADQPTPLSALLEEATRNNPDILAARRGCKRRPRSRLKSRPRLIRRSPFSTFRLAVRDRLRDSATAISPTLDSGSLRTCPIPES